MNRRQLLRELELASIALFRLSPPQVLHAARFLWTHENITWLASAVVCIALILGGSEEGIVCFTKLSAELQAEPAIKRAYAIVLRALRSNSMACATTHKTSTRTQGPGVCCAALSAAGFGPGNPPPIGTRVVAQTQATPTSASHCIVCQVSSSTSAKHPGQPVIKRGKNFVAGSAIACPSSAGGCCALVGA